MKRKARRGKTASKADRDTMRPHYDFSHAVRANTAARYAEGSNVVLIEAEKASSSARRRRRTPNRRRSA